MTCKTKCKELKDHEVGIFVNELTAVAKKYGHTQQLREHIRLVVITHLKREK